MRKVLFVGLLLVAGCERQRQRDELATDEVSPAPQSCTALESRTFVRTSGPANEFEVPFALANPQGGPFVLRVEPDLPSSVLSTWYCQWFEWMDSCRELQQGVRSATISLNGRQVLGPSDFAHGPSVLERTVSLEANNSLNVQLTSATGTSFSVSILDGDDTPPIVSIATPLAGVVLTESPTLVRGSVDDPSAVIAVNGVETRRSSRNFVTGAELDDGTNTITAVATDPCGNSSSTHVEVELNESVDVDLPADVDLTAEAGKSCQGLIRVSGTAHATVGDVSVRAVGRGFDIAVPVAKDGSFSAQIDIGSAESFDIVATAGTTTAQKSLTTTPVECPVPDQCHEVGTCNPYTGTCSNPPKQDGVLCDDGSACTQSDTCQVGACAPGALVTIDDSNPCTDDACDPVTGVSHTPVAAGTSCSDNDACNGAETCDDSGRCVAGDTVVCVATDTCHGVGVCDPTTGACSNPALPDGEACDDATVCNGRETCRAGACTPGAPLAIDDDNPCTTDACDPSTGAYHDPLPAGTSCETDNDVCNGASVCDARGGCQPGTPLILDDADPCTADACDPVTGVSHAALVDGSACEDGDLCTRGDTCQAGVCRGPNPIVCSSADPCQVAHCVSTTGECASSLVEECTNLPSDPSSLASPIDPTLATGFGDSLTFLFTGSDPIQTGVDVSRMDPKRTALLRGVVLTTNGDPLPGARVSVLRHPEYGETKSREDGKFDLVVNGGDELVVVYERAGYVPSQRRLAATWQSSATAPDVRLAEFDGVAARRQFVLLRKQRPDVCYRRHGPLPRLVETHRYVGRRPC